MMRKVYFTVDEANRMIPFLEESFGRMLQMRGQARVFFRRLDRLGFAPDGDDFPLDPGDASLEVISERASLKALVNALRDEIAKVHRTGCLIKGLDRGLVDWYAKHRGREVFLCWKLGEKEVLYWHELDAGFVGRRPVSELSDADSSSEPL